MAFLFKKNKHAHQQQAQQQPPQHHAAGPQYSGPDGRIGTPPSGPGSSASTNGTIDSRSLEARGSPPTQNAHPLDRGDPRQYQPVSWITVVKFLAIVNKTNMTISATIARGPTSAKGDAARSSRRSTRDATVRHEPSKCRSIPMVEKGDDAVIIDGVSLSEMGAFGKLHCWQGGRNLYPWRCD